MNKVIRIREKGAQKGIALFMVISTVAVLAILITELTYSTQVNARMAYNFIDNVKAYYLAKTGFKISLLRLKAYIQVKGFLGQDANKQIAPGITPDILNQIWSIPFIFPIPIPKEATMGESDAIKEFLKESKLTGSFTALISGESSKVNLNNLLVKTLPQAAQATQVGQTPQSSPQEPQPTEAKFRPFLENMISKVIEHKKQEDREFADTYRNVQGKDIVDAMVAYLTEEDSQGSQLPGFKPITPKNAPFYSLTELHFIPGLSDGLYKLMEPLLTVYSTPGININKASKDLIRSLFPQLTEDELDQLMRHRDDPDVGKPWANADDFWKALAETSLARNIDQIRQDFNAANLQFITDESSFKIGIQATQGLAVKNLEAYVIIDMSQKPATSPPSTSTPPSTTNPQTQPATDNASAKKPTGLNLIYWRML